MMMICRLGSNGLEVGVLGFGCMSFGGMYGLIDKVESFVMLKKVLDFGVIYFDMVIIYGVGFLEMLIGEFMCDNVNSFIVVLKCGIVL